MNRIAVASDHGGYRLKLTISDILREKGYEIEDLGTDSPESVDYPDFAHDVAERIAAGSVKRAILICGTGIGMSITANRYRNVRAALCNDVYSAKMSRLHNDSNVLVLGGRVVGPGVAEDIVETWLETKFEGGRHTRRLKKIEQEQLRNVIHELVTDRIEGRQKVDKGMIEKIVAEAIEVLGLGNDKGNGAEK